MNGNYLADYLNFLTIIEFYSYLFLPRDRLYNFTAFTQIRFTMNTSNFQESLTKKSSKISFSEALIKLFAEKDLTIKVYSDNV